MAGWRESSYPSTKPRLLPTQWSFSSVVWSPTWAIIITVQTPGPTPDLLNDNFQGWAENCHSHQASYAILPKTRVWKHVPLSQNACPSRTELGRLTHLKCCRIPTVHLNVVCIYPDISFIRGTGVGTFSSTQLTSPLSCWFSFVNFPTEHSSAVLCDWSSVGSFFIDPTLSIPACDKDDHWPLSHWSQG